MRAAARRFRDAPAGSVLPLVAFGMAALLGAAALTVDLGSLHVAKRRAQGAVDLAAITAAQVPDRAEGLARSVLASNGFDAPQTLTVEPGRYVADAARPIAARFEPGSVPANAVRVRMQDQARLVFGRVVTGRSHVAMSATALAARADFASFAVGSRLLGLRGGVANRLLGALLGTQLSLTAMDYEALALARLDAVKILDRLAVALDVRAATFGEILRLDASLGQFAGAMAEAGGGDVAAAAASALGRLATSLTGATARFPVGRLIGLGEAGGALPGSGSPALPVGALDLLTGLAEIANDRRQVQVDFAPEIPGLLQLGLTLSIGERPQASANLASVGDTVRTAQTRLLLEAGMTAPLGLGQITLPVYLEAARGSGTLSRIACPWSSREQTSVEILAQPGLLSAAIAPVPLSAIDVEAPSPLVASPARLLRFGPISVSGRSHLAVESPRPASLVFGRAEIESGRARSVGTSGLASSLVGSLVGRLALDVDVAGLGLPLGLTAGAVRGAVAGRLADMAPLIDGVLEPTLGLLGIGVGELDVRVTGIRCDRAVLVQ